MSPLVCMARLGTIFRPLVEEAEDALCHTPSKHEAIRLVTDMDRGL